MEANGEQIVADLDSLLQAEHDEVMLLLAVSASTNTLHAGDRCDLAPARTCSPATTARWADRHGRGGVAYPLQGELLHGMVAPRQHVAFRRAGNWTGDLLPCVDHRHDGETGKSNEMTT